jgi:diguanylate cyclase (GGDEF)-like protein
MRRNGRRAWIVSVRDITEQKRWEEALRHQALHDALTGLPNRAQFASCLATLTGAATATGPLAVLLLDLDGFKEVNDTLGHQAGDGLLQQVGRRLVDATRAVDLVARLGGDEFGVLAPNAGKPGASAVARRILRALARPFEVDGRAVRVGVSLGVALGPAHGEDPVTLMKRADAAMYAAKRGGGGYRVHAPDGEARPNQSP